MSKQIKYLFGPWFGEFGWEIVYWRGYVINVIQNLGLCPEQCTVASYVGNRALYPEGINYIPLSRDDIPSYPNMYFLKYYHSDSKVFLHVHKAVNRKAFNVVHDPIKIHDRWIVKFGKPKHNQKFVPLQHTKTFPEVDKYLSIDQDKPTIMIFVRARLQNQDKNKSFVWWESLIRKLEPSYNVIIGGLEGRRFHHYMDTRVFLPVYREDWVNFQLYCMSKADLCVCGESGSVFFATHALKPLVVFGDERERDRICITDNIFSTPVHYIPTRDISVDMLVNSIKKELKV